MAYDRVPRLVIQPRDVFLDASRGIVSHCDDHYDADALSISPVAA